MNIDERLDALTRNLELLASLHEDDWKKTEQRFARVDDILNRIATATEMLMLGMENHEQRIGALEGR